MQSRVRFMVIQKIIDGYFEDIKMIICPTIRAENGLALSSRNSLQKDFIIPNNSTQTTLN